MNKSCLLCGVGGQGVVLASKLIAYAAMEQGKFVRTTETIGMAQRGGSVVSHVRMGTEVHSPLIPLKCADMLLAFEPAEAVRCLPYLKVGGTVIVSSKAVKPVTATLSGSTYEGTEMLDYLKKNVENLAILDGEEICSQAGSSRVLNVALLGAAAASGVLDISAEEMESAVAVNVKEKFLDMNRKALTLGMTAFEKA
ncbi:indolepyruvate oxidoreductase subunit beta [Muricomes sp. OA1]|uniref:Indolepyruvate oxidoreductase subunit beta n=2 Tax=Lachnospiraceae TaxID=186803 RepID=A0A174F298_9FIRM|nr:MULTISPECIES: indolepyruvate oxidoreductase subunit beta [Clostridia]MCH1973568.1 indolepyruvate oxidoreductase subunit beta [Muricomes sp. OA1]MRM87061.1 pyruvate ferredoxin oxidoreductase [Faecalicatena contorta]RGC29679.1 pyruvate ferredoxin oxidoreductase [Hungatella hathewayi]CUO43831.1 indolepyruvate oxidoreductase subunit beta [[Eubacterium] contortum] [Faecalicatena contorta]GKH32330.1 pyruvate:ferredoxin (flavodoxin) oxidoreductase [Faecalicatena contorta]